MVIGNVSHSLGEYCRHLLAISATQTCTKTAQVSTASVIHVRTKKAPLLQVPP